MTKQENNDLNGLSYEEIKSRFAQEFFKKFLKRETGLYKTLEERIECSDSLHEQRNRDLANIKVMGSIFETYPTFNQLKEYINETINEKEWDQLETMSNLIQGEPDKNYLTGKMVESLEDHNFDSYRELNKIFPGHKVSERNIHETYNGLISKWKFQGDPRWNYMYDRDVIGFNQEIIGNLYEISEISKVTPKLSEETKEFLLKLNQEKLGYLKGPDYEKSTIQEMFFENIDDINNFFGIYQNQEISEKIQRNLIIDLNTDILKIFYEKGSTKLSQDQILGCYDQIKDTTYLSQIMEIIKLTECLPGDNKLNEILKGNNHRTHYSLEHIEELLNKGASIEDEVIHNIVESYIYSANDANKTISEYEKIQRKVGSFYEEFNIEPSEELARVYSNVLTSKTLGNLYGPNRDNQKMLGLIDYYLKETKPKNTIHIQEGYEKKYDRLKDRIEELYDEGIIPYETHNEFVSLTGNWVYKNN